MFLTAISSLKSGNYATLDTNEELIYTIKSPGKLKIIFFAQYVILSKDDNCLQLGYDELGASIVRQIQENTSIVFNEKIFEYKINNADKLEEEKIFLKSLIKAFEAGVNSSPYENVRIMCEEVGIEFDGTYNKYLYHLLLKYTHLFENIVQQNFLTRNSKINFLLEDNTAKILEGMGENALNIAGSLIKKNPVGVLMDLGKVVGKKALSSTAKKHLGTKKLIIVTNEKAIYAKGAESFLIGNSLNETLMALEMKQDEDIPGALDIYYEGDKLLDNVSRKKWDSFKNIIRKLAKQNSNRISQSSSYENYAEIENKNTNDDDMDILTDKLTKLKNLLSEGFISEKDYEIKKNKLLGLKEENKEPTAMKKYETTTATPMTNTTIKNIASENSTKKRLTMLIIFLLFGGLGVHRFYIGKNKSGFLLAILGLVNIIILTPIIDGADIYDVLNRYFYSEFILVVGFIFSIMLVLDFFKIILGKFKDKNGLSVK